MKLPARPGFKRVTQENWLEQDGASAVWATVDMRDGTSRPTAGEDWIADVVAIKLGDHVPEEVATLFDFAKGALGYGHYYYPLFTLVTQQLLRVADIAVDELFDALTLTPKPQSLARRLTVLHERLLISDEQYRMLDLLRKMRNSATHSSFPTIMMPTQAVRDMRWIADLISGLPWPKVPSSPEPSP